METSQAIMAFSQSEKVKTSLICASQSLELLTGLPFPKRGGTEIIRMNIEMMRQEIQLARNLSEDESWDEIEKSIGRAVVMIDSGVAPESVVHLTQALSQVTSIGHRSMTVFEGEGVAFRIFPRYLSRTWETSLFKRGISFFCELSQQGRSELL